MGLAFIEVGIFFFFGISKELGRVGRVRKLRFILLFILRNKNFLNGVVGG